MTLFTPFVDGMSPRFEEELLERNADVDGIFENVLSVNECPSEEPLLMIVDRSFSDKVRGSNDDC